MVLISYSKARTLRSRLTRRVPLHATLGLGLTGYANVIPHSSDIICDTTRKATMLLNTTNEHRQWYYLYNLLRVLPPPPI